MGSGESNILSSRAAIKVWRAEVGHTSAITCLYYRMPKRPKTFIIESLKDRKPQKIEYSTLGQVTSS